VLERPTDNLELIKRVLGKDYIELHLDKLVVDEDADETRSKVHLQLSDTNGAKLEVDGDGVGLVDATFNALLERYGVEYQSLKSIELAKFAVSAKMDTKKEKAGVDSMGRVTLGVLNSEGKLFEFHDESRSISRSSARAVLAAVEYFVNAERAFITLHRARMDAKERRRDDLVTRYTRELAEVVKSTSFTEVIEGMKQDL
jgi:hypothetical protein